MYIRLLLCRTNTFKLLIIVVLFFIIIIIQAHSQGVAEITPDALAIISHSTEHHMRNILERLTACCMHRNDPHKVYYYYHSRCQNQIKFEMWIYQE